MRNFLTIAEHCLHSKTLWLERFDDQIAPIAGQFGSQPKQACLPFAPEVPLEHRGRDQGLATSGATYLDLNGDLNNELALSGFSDSVF